MAEETYLLCDQLRTVDAVRMIRRCGSVDPRYVKQVLTLVHYFLTLEPD